MADVSDYPDAVRRIAESDVPDDVTSEAEVRAALRDSDSAQVTLDVAQNLAESVLTEERVLDAIQSTGELPSEGELGAFTEVADDYDMGDRQREVRDRVRDRVATVEDVDEAVDGVADAREGPLFREDVETGVATVESTGKEFIGSSTDDVVSAEARERGAPRESDFRRESAQIIAQSDSVTPSEVVDGTEAQTPVNVIRDANGDPIAATGGPGGETSERVAEQIGADYLSAEDVTQNLDVEGRGERADVTLHGTKVGEVDVE